MALAGAIAWFRVAEFSVISVWTAVVVGIDEIETGVPWARTEDHRRLLNEERVVRGCFR